MPKLFSLPVILILLIPGAGLAAQFQFGTMVRAGVAGAQDWELAAGDSSGALPPNANTSHLNPHYNNNSPQLFEIGYVRSTNTAFLRVYRNTNPASNFTQVSYNPVGGAAVVGTALWTLPASGFYVRATQVTVPSSIQVSNLQLLGAVNVIQPIQQTTMLAAQSNTGGGAMVTQSSDIVFRTTGSGDWTLRGELTLTGLPNGSNPGARRSQLQFGLNADAEAPEPGTFGLMAAALGTVWALNQRRRRARVLVVGGTLEQ